MTENNDQRASLADRLFNGWLHDFAVAGAFLTRLPFRPGGVWRADALAGAMRAFPLIGMLVGAIAGGALWLAASTSLHPLACALVGLIVAAGVSGALHEDGLADMADAMGGGTRERRLEIMRDSRIGAYGVLALVLAVGLKAAILSGLPGPGVAWGALVVAAAISRAVMAPCMVLTRPARGDGLAADAGRPDGLTAALGLGLGAVVGIAVFGWALGLAALVAALAAALATAWLARARFGGYTGDVLGAVQQTAEISVLLAVGGLLA